ncbi:alpha/beta fold hydrolase [Actinoplanes sp. NPDC051494]|uniref:alpha/beta fold hydrolase n=1 Tax=Actinoplanes sp. NPDC051494 TaxID=3363907 RepID=UPI00379787F5
MIGNLSPGTHGFTVAGTRQVYHVAGSGPVLVAHSGGPGVDFSYLRSPALEEHFTIVYPEPVGTGDSGRLPEGASFVATYAEFLAALIDHLDVPRVFLLGHSHGGLVAMRYTLDHPDRVAGLFLYSSPASTFPEFWADTERTTAEYLQRNAGNPEAAAAVAALGGFYGSTDAEKTAHLRACLPVYFADFWGRQAEFKDLRDAVRAWAVDFASRVFDIRAELPSIGVPTVVLTGRYDFICGPVWATMLHEAIPGSRLVILENSGHFGQLEEPGAFDAAVLSLLPSFEDRVRATFRRGDSAEVLRMARAEVDRARAAGEPGGEVEGLYAQARVAIRGGDLQRAQELASAALDVAVRAGDRRLEERPRHVLAAVARVAGKYAEARELYLASIALNKELGQPETVNSELHNLAFTELHLGNLDRARDLFLAGRERVFLEGYDSFVPYLCVAAAALASAEGDHALTARMIGLTDAAYAAIGQVPDPDDALEVAAARRSAVAALGAEGFRREYDAGAATTPAVAFGFDPIAHE